MALDDFVKGDENYEGEQRIVDDTFIHEVVDASSVVKKNEMDSFMKSVLPYHYEFIPIDNSLLENEGECVIDQISKTYGDKIKGLRREK